MKRFFSFFLLSAKRSLRRPAFLLSLLLALGAVFFFTLRGSGESLPDAGIFDEDGSALSEEIVSSLKEKGFSVEKSREELRKKVAGGTYDCGVVLNRGYEEKLLGGDTKGLASFLVSPTSFVPMIFRGHAAGAIFSQVMAVRSAEALKETGIDRNEILSVYKVKSEEQKKFTFTGLIVGEIGSEPLSRAETYFLSAVSLIFFSWIFYSFSGLFSGENKKMSRSVGVEKTLFSLVLPEILFRLAVWLLSVGLVGGILWETGLIRGKLISAACVFVLFLVPFALCAVGLLGKVERIRVFAFFLLLLSSFLLPIYLDLSLFSPSLALLRCFLPTYWLWLCTDHALLFLLGSLPLFFLAFLLVKRGLHRTNLSNEWGK